VEAQKYKICITYLQKQTIKGTLKGCRKAVATLTLRAGTPDRLAARHLTDTIHPTEEVKSKTCVQFVARQRNLCKNCRMSLCFENCF